MNWRYTNPFATYATRTQKNNMVYPAPFQEEPCFVISIASRMVGLHAQTLRYYERVGLIWPSRSIGRQRLYSQADIDRLRRIKTFTEDMGMNLAGAEVALKLVERVEELEQHIQKLEGRIMQLRARTTSRKPN
jgi:MerR family transcriptional regulator/heat shock protein HspR